MPEGRDSAGGRASSAGSGTLPSYLDADDLDRLPPSVWVPVIVPEFGGSVPQVLTRPIRQDVSVVPVYSTLEALQAGHGVEHQAAEVARDELFGMLEAGGLGLVSLDLFVPEECRADGWAEDEEWPEAPVEEILGEVVWTLWRPGGRGESVQVELHDNEHGQRVLPLYTSKETLRACAGPYQPGIAIRTNEVEQIAEQAGADVVQFNPVIALAARHQQSMRN